jgi:O-antigen ligase
MRRYLIEGGIYFLLVFTPFAFGGVEMWAQGIIQIVSGIVFVAWAWGGEGLGTERDHFRPESARAPVRLSLWIPIGLFVLLVLAQLVPLPPRILAALSPSTHALYSRTLPGYASGEVSDVANLPEWLIEETGRGSAGGDGSTGEEPGGAGGSDADLVPPGSDVLHPPVSALGSPTRITPARTLTVYPFQTWTRLSLLLCFVALFAVVTDYFQPRRRLTRLLRVAILSGFGVSLFGILQRLASATRLFWMRETAHEEFFGPFVNRNSYAAFAGTILPLAVCLCLSALRQWRAGREDVFPRIFFFGFAGIVMATGVFYSLSRGGMLSAGLSVLLIVALLLLFGRRGPELALLGVLVVVAGGFLLWIGVDPVVERVGTLSEGLSTPTFASRLQAWGQTVTLVADYPVFGTGLGTFRFAFLRYAPPGRAWWTTAHNEYLELICDTGLVGGTIVLLGFLAYLLLVLRPRSMRARTTPYVYTGLVAGLAALLVHSAVSSNLQVPANGLLVAILGGALLALVERQRLLSAQARGRRPEASPSAGDPE